MVDSLMPLPPISARVSKTAVSEKNPHHQNNQQQKERKPDIDTDIIEDDITIEITEEAKKENPKLPPTNNINIEV